METRSNVSAQCCLRKTSSHKIPAQRGYFDSCQAHSGPYPQAEGVEECGSGVSERPAFAHLVQTGADLESLVGSRLA